MVSIVAGFYLISSMILLSSIIAWLSLDFSSAVLLSVLALRGKGEERRREKGGRGEGEERRRERGGRVEGEERRRERGGRGERRKNKLSSLTAIYTNCHLLMHLPSCSICFTEREGTVC